MVTFMGTFKVQRLTLELSWSYGHSHGYLQRMTLELSCIVLNDSLMTSADFNYVTYSLPCCLIRITLLLASINPVIHERINSND